MAHVTSRAQTGGWELPCVEGFLHLHAHKSMSFSVAWAGECAHVLQILLILLRQAGAACQCITGMLLMAVG